MPVPRTTELGRRLPDLVCALWATSKNENHKTAQVRKTSKAMITAMTEADEGRYNEFRIHAESDAEGHMHFTVQVRVLGIWFNLRSYSDHDNARALKAAEDLHRHLSE